MTLFSLDTLLGIGGVIFATAYAWERLRSGGKQADADLIVALTNNLKAQKEINDAMTDQMAKMQIEHTAQMAKMQEQILNLQQQVGKLQGINEANDKKVKEYLELIANRNPELENTMLKIEELIRQVVPFMGDVKQWHEAIRTQLSTIETDMKPKVHKRKDA